MLKRWCSVDGYKMMYSMKKVIRGQYTYFCNAKGSHPKKRSAAHFKMNKSSTNLYGKRYHCKLFSLFNTVNPKVFRKSEPQTAGCWEIVQGSIIVSLCSFHIEHSSCLLLETAFLASWTFDLMYCIMKVQDYSRRM